MLKFNYMKNTMKSNIRKTEENQIYEKVEKIK